MAKLTHEQLLQEIGLRHYDLIDDKNYTNMQSRIIIQCPQRHLIETCLADFRKPSFTCPVCDKSINFINPKAVPQKEANTFRIIAFDQATENFGLSVFDNGKLVFYSLYKFSGDLVSRLVKIRTFIENIVIKEWQPDFIECEDIQYQSNGILTFKVLAMLLGIIQETLASANIDYDVVAPSVWRKYAGTAGKDRKTEKLLSQAVVKEKYNINVSDDVAEAILIGQYAVKTHSTVKMAFGRK